MSDTPITLEDAGTSAFSSLTASEAPAETQEATTSTEETPTQASEPSTEEVAPESPKEETPLDEFDPEKLPQELKPLYKNLMKGFTQGRQKDREEVLALKSELEKMRTDTPSGNNAPEKQEDLDPIATIERIAEQKVLDAKIKDFRSQAIQDYEGMDDRLKKPAEEGAETKYDPLLDAHVGAQLDVLLEKHIQEHGNELGFDYRAHGKRLVAEWDQYVQKNIEGFLTKQKVLAKTKETTIQRSNPKSVRSDAKPSEHMTLEQAADAAYRNLSVK